MYCDFLYSHDTQRNGRAQLTYKSYLYTFANIFMLAFPYGNVRVMSSYYFPSSNTDLGPPSVSVNNGLNCQDGVNWVCEHRYTPIANMVAWRNVAGTNPLSNWVYGTYNQIAFSRGSNAFIAMNRDESQVWRVTLQTGMTAGTYCNVIVNDDVTSCTNTVTVDSSGYATVSVPTLSAIAIHSNAKIN